MSRAALSVERVRYNRAEDHVTVSKKPFGSSPEESRSYPVGDFLALLASHIPAPYESLTYYYGVYSSSHRGKQTGKQGRADGPPIEGSRRRPCGSPDPLTARRPRFIPARALSGRRLSTTSRTLTPTYRTRSIRIEPSSQYSPARKRTPENSRLGPYRLRTPAKPFNSTRNGPFRRSPLRSCT